MIIKRAERKRPFSERPNRSFSAKEISTVAQDEPEREQVLRLQPIRGTDSIDLLGFRAKDQRRYVMPSQIVLNEHIYSDDKNISTGRHRFLVSNHSRRTITLPRVMYCDEGYSTHKYNVLHSVNKWSEDRKGSLRPVADPARQTLVARPPPILACTKKLPDFCKELTDSTEQEVSAVAPQPKSFYLLQNETRDREIQRGILGTLTDVNLVKRPKASIKGSGRVAKPVRKRSTLPLQYKPPLIIVNSSVSQHMHKTLEAQTEAYSKSISSCSDSEQDMLDKLSQKPLTLAEYEKRQLSKQTAEAAKQDLEHASAFYDAKSPNYHELNTSQTETSCTDASRHTSRSQTTSPDDVCSRSNPTQSETIYGNILSFERKLLPESGNDSFAIRPLHYCTSEDMIRSCESSESTSLSSISLPLLSTDTPTDQSIDISDHKMDTPINARLSCDAPISPVVSRVPTATPPPTHTRRSSRRAPQICMPPPLAMHPSLPPSKLLSSRHDSDHTPREKTISQLRTPLNHIISGPTHMPSAIRLRGYVSRQFALHSSSAPRPSARAQLQAEPKTSRLQERGAQHLRLMPDPTKLAGLIVHSLVAIEPISFPNAVQTLHTNILAPPVPLAPISSELHQAAPLTDVHGDFVPSKQSLPIKVGISRYPLQLQAFIRASTSDTKVTVQRSRIKTAPSTLSKQASGVPKLRCYKLRSISAYVPVSHLEPLCLDSSSFRPHTAPALVPLSPHSPASVKLLYNTPMTIGRENVIRSVTATSSPYTTHDIRIFPEDLSDGLATDTCIGYQTPHVPIRFVRSLYAPMKVPTNEKQVSAMCDIVSARTNALTERDIEAIKQIFYNTSHDSASSPYAQQVAIPDQRNYVAKLFTDVRKEAEIRRAYGIDRVKRGLNMELYKRIKRSDGDTVIHKIRGIQPDTDSSAADGFEPPDFRELTSETTSPRNATAIADKNLKAVKAFLYTPSSSPLEESLPTDYSKEDQHRIRNYSPQAPNVTEIMANTPTHNPVISILKRSSEPTQSRSLTAPAHNPHKGTARSPFNSQPAMMMDYIAYLQAYTPKFQGPPRYYRIAKSAPLNTAPRDSDVTKLLKEGFNRQNNTSFGISRPVSCTPSRNCSRKSATLPILIKATSKIDESGSQVLLDDHESLVVAGAQMGHDQSIEPMVTLQENETITEEIENKDIVPEMLDNNEGQEILTEESCAHPSTSAMQFEEALVATFVEDDPNIHKVPVKNVTAIPDECVTAPLGEILPDPPLNKHDERSRRRAIAGDKTISNKKACRRFYKEAIIDRDVSRIYWTYAQRTTARARPHTATELNYEKLLSRPLTVSKDRIIEKIDLYQTDAKKVGPATPSLISRMHAYDLH